MPHILQFHKGNNNNIFDWSPSSKIQVNDFRDLPDKTNVLSSAAGTSIPSPIARLYLFKTAFEILSAQLTNKPIESTGIYAGLVSETLDLLEMLYKYGCDGKRFRYHKWVFDNTQGDNTAIEQFFGTLGGHKLMSTSFKQAVAQAPFHNKIEITLIYYKEGNKELLIGGTSPFTFVFTSPNFKRKLAERGFNKISGLVSAHHLFSSEYKHLHERDEAFIRYMEELSRTANLPNSFNSFSDYVTGIKTRYGSKFNNPGQVLKNIQGNDVLLTSAGINLKQVDEAGFQQTIHQHSDFKLVLPKNTAYKNELTPLFLLDQMEYNGQYTSPVNKWSNSTKVSDKAYNESKVREIINRELPGLEGIRYPFLSSFDFFENCLVKLPGYMLNDERFVTVVNNQTFALPLKPLFFHFFPVDIFKNYISAEVNDNRITFVLKLELYGPVKGTWEIEYRKTYTPDFIIEYQGILGIYPFTRTSDAALMHINKYTVASYEKTNAPHRLKSIVLFKSDGQTVVNDILLNRSEYKIHNIRSDYMKTDESFDIIQINFPKDNANCGCTIIPKFKLVKNGAEEYICGIDFGTSNTHIEYGKVNSGRISQTNPFTIQEHDMQFFLLNKPEEIQHNDGAEQYNDYEKGLGTKVDEVGRVAMREMMPFQVGTQLGAKAKFPFRTATCESDSFRVKEENQLFIDGNIGFFMEEDAINEQVLYTTDLKWRLEKSTSDKLNKARISLFFRQLLMMIRAKLLLAENNDRADINKLSVGLSFPISMGPNLQNALVKLFEAQKAEIMGLGLQKVIKVTESISPYYHLRHSNRSIQNEIFCNIDIGGGTTDIALVDKSKEDLTKLMCYCSSVRFAGKELWGSNGNGAGISENGFLEYYKNFAQKNDPNIYSKLEKVLIDGNLDASEIINLLFSKEEYGFENIFTHNTEFRAVLLIHYSAILFYLVQLAKLYKVDLPRTISFSGKGSEYLDLIFPSKTDIKGYTQNILNIFSDKKVRDDFTIEKISNPKVITAKGSIHFVSEKTVVSNDDWNIETKDENNEKKLVPVLAAYLGLEDEENKKTGLTYGELRSNKEYFTGIMAKVGSFFNLLFDNAELCKTVNKILEIKDFHKYKSFFIGKESNITEYGVLRESFLTVINDADPSEVISDSPFFFPFRHSLNELSQYIENNSTL